MGLELAKLIFRVSTDTSRMSGDFSFIRRNTDSLVRYMNTALATVGMGNVIGQGFKLAADLEKTTVAFDVMTGSLQRSKDLIQELRSFSKDTPFSYESLQKGSRLLLAYSIPVKELIPTLKMLGDVTAGTGAHFDRLALAYGQIRSKGRLYAQEVRQFAEAGVPLLAMLAKAYDTDGKAMSKMIELGKVGFRDVHRILQELTTGTGRFSDIMKELSTTTGGQAVKALDEFKFLLQDIFMDLAPLSKEALASTRAMLSYFGQLFSNSSGDFRDFTNEFADGLRTMREHWDKTWELMKVSSFVGLSEILAKNNTMVTLIAKTWEEVLPQSWDNVWKYISKSFANRKTDVVEYYRALSEALDEWDSENWDRIGKYIKARVTNANRNLEGKPDLPVKSLFGTMWDDLQEKIKQKMSNAEKEMTARDAPIYDELQKKQTKLFDDFLKNNAALFEALYKLDPRTEGFIRRRDQLAEEFGKLWSDTTEARKKAERERDKKTRTIEEMEVGMGEDDPEKKKKERKARDHSPQRIFDLRDYGRAMQQELFKEQRDKLTEIVDQEKIANEHHAKVVRSWDEFMANWKATQPKPPFSDYNRIEQAQRAQRTIRQNQEQRNFYELKRFLNSYSDSLKSIGEYIRRAGFLK